jgi:copper(I)-binding protein
MRHRLGRAGVGAVIVGLAVFGVEGAQRDVVATEAWVKASAAGTTTTTAFALIENPTAYTVYLRSASSDAAERVEFHDATSNDAVVKDVQVASYDSLAMDPKGVYMRLVGLKRPLKEGDTVSLVLVTEAGLSLPVSAAVRQE